MYASKYKHVRIPVSGVLLLADSTTPGTIVESSLKIRNRSMGNPQASPGSISSGSDDPTSDSQESDDDADSDESEPETAGEREAREHERHLVLEAAGLILKKDVKPPPRPPRRAKSVRRRRAPPTQPSIRTSVVSHSPKELPPTPDREPEVEQGVHLDDAFERYESFRLNQNDLNRLSFASISSLEVPPSPTSPISRKPSRESYGRPSSTFLNFLGRSKTPVESERTLPSISAPMPQNLESSARSNSSGFGSSWASLIDPSALEGIPPGERRRQEAIFEFITTESAYVRDLQLIVEVFYSSMLPLLDSKAVTVIFANVEDILLTNTTFMSVLEERQKECRLYVDRVGDILQTHISNMGLYMEYCVNQANAIKVLQSLRDSNPELAAHLQRLRDDPVVRNLDLSSYLLVPMQRITRYPLLIRQILHYTEFDEERKKIEKALDMSEKILAHINETIRYQEGRETLKRISENLWIGQGRLDLTAPTRYMGERRLLKEGILLKAKSGRRLQAFLCNDIMVLTNDPITSLYRMPIPLAEVQVSELSAGRDETGFQVALAYPRGGEAIRLKAASARDCQVWMQAIQLASRHCREAEKRTSPYAKTG